MEQPVAQQSTTNKQAEPEASAPSFEQRQKVDSLRLMRSQINEQLQRARTVTQRQMLHHQLQAIEAEIGTLEQQLH